jgi:hypothetical protein
VTGPPASWGGYEESPNGQPGFYDKPLVYMSTIEPIEPKFVEYPLLQAAMFHLVAGKPGVGKGALCTRWIARCTTGEMYGTPRRALWLSSEEDAARDLRPRLDVAGADITKVALVPNDFRLPRDTDWLHDRIKAEGNVGLVVIDPMSNHIEKTNSSVEEEVREALQPLLQVAAALDVPMLGIRHVSTKEGRGNFLGRILGATGWVGVSRAVLGVAQDFDGVVHVRAIKGNRVPLAESGRRFKLVGVEYNGWNATVVRAVEAGNSLIDLDDLVTMIDRKTFDSNSEMARGEILRILRESGGICESDKLDADVIRETGLKPKTIRNLRTEMKDRGWLRAFPEKDEEGKIERWMISLTNAAPFHLEAEDPLPFTPHSPLDNARARTPDGMTGSGYLQGDLLAQSGPGFGESGPGSKQSGPGRDLDSRDLDPEQSGPGPDLSDDVVTVLASCPVCDSTNIGEISGRCHACGSKVNEINVN